VPGVAGRARVESRRLAPPIRLSKSSRGGAGVALSVLRAAVLRAVVRCSARLSASSAGALISTDQGGGAHGAGGVSADGSPAAAEVVPSGD
jgi:hypothetical protein